MMADEKMFRQTRSVTAAHNPPSGEPSATESRVEVPASNPDIEPESDAQGSDAWDDLESVLDTFEERRTQDLAARRDAEAAEAAFRTGCICVLTDSVVPTFEAAASSLGRRGHECAVTKRIADYDVPSADLTIRPYVPNERWVRRSRLSMRCLSTEGFVVFGEIQPPRKDPISTSRTYPLEEVGEGWIQNQVIRFVRAVLAEY